MAWLWPWRLERSPLAPGVPDDGSETVAGLRTLERLRMEEQLRQGRVAAGGGGAAARAAAPPGSLWQRVYQRYRGPFIEQLTMADVKAAPKSWALFWKGSERGHAVDGYSLPASLAVLQERTEENLVSFLPNYLRLAAAVCLAAFYLRPKALLGAAAVAFSMYRALAAAVRRHEQEAAAAAAAADGGRGGAARQQQAAAQRARPPAADPNDAIATAALSVLTWLLVAYTRCLPMMLLACGSALAAVLLHCGLRRAPSEYRFKGRQPLGFTWRQVLGREPAPAGADPRALFFELGRAATGAAELQLRRAWWYCRYFARSWLDRLRRPRALGGAAR